VLSAEALAAKAAAVQANASITQQWWRHVVQPLTDLVPALVKHPSRDLSTRSTRTGNISSRAQQSLPTLLVIDGFNLLHQHPSTKRLIDDAEDMYAAQQHMHTLLRQYAEQKRVHVLLVYDAYRVPPSSRSRQTLTKLDYRVSTLHEAGKEADTVIIELVSNVLTREAAAAAQGHLGTQAPQLCNIHVHTNDNRIQEGVTVASMAAEQQVRRHIVHVNCMSNTRLSEALALVENKLQSHRQQQQQQQVGLSWQGSAQLPDPQQNTEAWARAYLATASGSDSDSHTGSSSSSSSDSKGRRRRLTQEQAEQEAAAAALAQGLSDDQLLQLSGAADVRAPAFVAGAAAVSADSSWEDTDSLPSTQAAAAAAGTDAASVAPSAAIVGPNSSSSRSGSRSATQELDALLNLDLDSVLGDML
jgi:predicted RNA-binding protein with PIN domain